MHAVQGATPAVWGVILQFPFYAGIAGVITTTHLNRADRACVRWLSTAHNVSRDRGDLLGGARRLRSVRRLEMGHRSALRHDRGARAEGAPRLGRRLPTISAKRWPIWCSPSGCCRSWDCFGLRARDVMGYTFVVFLVLVPVVLLLVTMLGATLSYPL